MNNSSNNSSEVSTVPNPGDSVGAVDGFATPRQIAFLKYMGVKDAEKRTKKEVSDIYGDLRRHLLGDNASEERNEDFDNRRNNWQKVKFELHPDLYEHESYDYIFKILPERLHDHVRSRIKRARKKLTKEIVKRTLQALCVETPSWWKSPDRKDVFIDKLAELFPDCVTPLGADWHDYRMIYNHLCSINAPAGLSPDDLRVMRANMDGIHWKRAPENIDHHARELCARISDEALRSRLLVLTPSEKIYAFEHADRSVPASRPDAPADPDPA